MNKKEPFYAATARLGPLGVKIVTQGSSNKNGRPEFFGWGSIDEWIGGIFTNLDFNVVAVWKLKQLKP